MGSISGVRSPFGNCGGVHRKMPVNRKASVPTCPYLSSASSAAATSASSIRGTSAAPSAANSSPANISPSATGSSSGQNRSLPSRRPCCVRRTRRHLHHAGPERCLHLHRNGRTPGACRRGSAARTPRLLRKAARQDTRRGTKRWSRPSRRPASSTRSASSCATRPCSP